MYVGRRITFYMLEHEEETLYLAYSPRFWLSGRLYLSKFQKHAKVCGKEFDVKHDFFKNVGCGADSDFNLFIRSNLPFVLFFAQNESPRFARIIKF